jgi:coenzyme F420-dependent glucose-6-phosphate dehydrogenase
VPELGYALSSEEHAPNQLVENARRAEEVGFPFALISDHFHPWIPRQGHSPLVWAVIGGIAQVTRTLRLGTGVTCPTMRIHPAIVAQAAATVGAMMPGRFFLGVGAGERLNEHILADHWPRPSVRQAMLSEAIELMRQLWTGGTQSFEGQFYEVENARVFDLPEPAVPIYVAASGPEAAQLAGQVGDGFISTAPEAKLIEQFEQAGGKGKPKYGQFTVCYDPDEEKAKRIAHEWWPNAALPDPLSTELSLPEHFESAAESVTPEQTAKSVLCSPDPAAHLEKIEEFAKAGFSHVYVHQVGPDQEAFFRFYEREILPRFRGQKGSKVIAA